MPSLKLASCMAENTESFCGAVAGYLGEALGISIEYVSDIPWQERERLFDAGEIQVLWLCGLPYVQKADRSHPAIELLAAPIPTGERYLGRPVYFSDLVVRRDSPYQSLFDLRAQLGPITNRARIRATTWCAPISPSSVKTRAFSAKRSRAVPIPRRSKCFCAAPLMARPSTARYWIGFSPRAKKLPNGFG